MTTYLILWLCTFPFVLFMYAILKNFSAPDKKYIFGVTLNAAMRKDAEVEEITREYKKQMRIWFWIMVIFPALFLWVPHFSILFCIWLLWLSVSCFCFMIPFGIANVKLKELKEKKGWKTGKSKDVVVELKQAGRIRMVCPIQFLPPIFLSLAASVVFIILTKEQNAGILIAQISLAVITPFFLLAAIWMDRQRTEVLSQDSDVNINYARAKKKCWNFFWLFAAWVHTVYTIAMTRCLQDISTYFTCFVVGSVIYCVLLLAALWRVLKKIEKITADYEKKRDVEPDDDDDNWLYGLIYYNPKDRRSGVEKRQGVGVTTNMARPAGKVLVIFLIVVFLQLPVLGAWLILMDFTPIELSVDGYFIEASQIRREYRIPMLEVDDYTLLTKEELPRLSRESGTSMEDLKKGDYRVPEQGKCKVFMNPKNDRFLRIEMNGETYYLSGADDEETMAVYEALNNLDE